MTTTTLGRRPTLGEVLGYYTQSSFLRYLLHTLQHRRVVLVISPQQHWEPNWERDEVRARTVADLRGFILDKAAAAFPGIAPEVRPDYYPAFHQSVWKGAREETAAPPDNTYMDCIFEADLPTWHDAFRDVAVVVNLFEHYGVPYQHKFSGHRSLHIIIPGDILPQGYRGQAASKLAGALLRWSSSQAHHLPRITRLPYSLNEDTGLVCLPVEPGKLDRFRPWQANLHLVRVPDSSWDLWGTAADEANLATLLGTLKSAEDCESVAPEHGRQSLRRVTPTDVLDPYRDRLDRVDGTGPVARAWARLGGSEPMPEPALLEGLREEDTDARWLTVEAYLVHGTTLSDAAVQALLAQDEEYVSAAATDVLLRFEDEIAAPIAQTVGNLTAYTPTGARAAYLLSRSSFLRDAVFERLIASDERSHETRIAVACLEGAMLGDWQAALALAEPARQDRHLPPPDRARLRRKLRALEMMSNLGRWDKQAESDQARRLAGLGPAVTDLLLIAASSPDRRFRRGIVTALAELGDPRATGLLIRALNDDYTQVRRRAIAGLVRIGAPAVEPLIAAAASDQVGIRRNAIRCLGTIGAARTKPVIIGALHDAEEVVRRQAVRALQAMASPNDLEALKQFLREASPANALQAIAVLETLGETCTRALETMASQEHTPAAAFYVARQGSPAGREILVAQLDRVETRNAAVEYLRELRDPRCVPYLAAQLDAASDWHGVFLALELGEIGTGEAVDALIHSLARDNHLIRRGAVRGLAKARNPVAIPALIACLEDGDSKVRKLASNALVSFGETAVPAVAIALAETGAAEARRRSVLLQVQVALDKARGHR